MLIRYTYTCPYCSESWTQAVRTNKPPRRQHALKRRQRSGHPLQEDTCPDCGRKTQAVFVPAGITLEPEKFLDWAIRLAAQPVYHEIVEA